MLVEAGATLKDIKSVTFQKNMCQWLNLDHFETTKSNFKKIVSPALKKLSWKNDGLAVGISNFTL